MNIYRYFSPEEEVKKYYSEFSGSIQNKSHVKALEYIQKIESLRSNSSNILGINSSHLLSFQHNKYYTEKLIFSFLKINENWIIFTDEKDNHEFKKCKSVLKLEKLIKSNKLSLEKENILVWISNLLSADKNLFESVSKLKKECLNCFVYLSADNILYDCIESNSFLKELSFISFDPSKLFQEYGTNLFWFKKELTIIPLFMGSNAAKLSSSGGGLTIKQLPHSLEIGTSNLISLLMLERFFHFLDLEGQKAFSNLSSRNLNFNLISSLKS